MGKVSDVDTYISEAPAPVRAKLKQIRKIIKQAAPRAEEKLSYGMPYYGYHGRLAYFAHAKNHIGLYIPPPIIENHANELKNYVTAKATVQLPLSKELPVALVKKLVTARVKWNEEKDK